MTLWNSDKFCQLKLQFRKVNGENVIQICVGKVTTLHLYQGAFVDIGGVYDG